MEYHHHHHHHDSSSSNNAMMISSSAMQRRRNQFHRTFRWQAMRSHHNNSQHARNNNNRASIVGPVARSGAASVVVGDKLFIFGGFGGGTGRLDDFWSYDFPTATWSEVPVLSHSKPGCRENNGVVISDSSRFIYLFGGYNGQTWLNDLWKYDIETQMWSCLQESSGETGQQNPHPNENKNNAGSGEMSAAAAAAAEGSGGIVPLRGPSRRFGYVSVVHQNTLIVWGGFDGIRWLNDLHRFDFRTGRWEQLHQNEAMIPSPRSCPAWAKEGSCVYITGGYDGVERKSDFFCLDLDTIEWTPLQCYGTPPSPRYFHSCWLYNSKLFCYAGYSGVERLADMFAFDLETQHWSLIECSNPPGDPNIPTGRSSLVAQVYKNSLYVFSGYSGRTVLNDFYRFQLQPIGIPAPGLCSDLALLVNNPHSMADVRFACGADGTIVHAHSAILVARSEFFRALLTGQLRESNNRSLRQGEDDDQPIPLPHVEAPVFIKVMEYVYTDSIDPKACPPAAAALSSSGELGGGGGDGDAATSLSNSVASPLGLSVALLVASEHFLLHRLKAIAEEWIMSEISEDTVIPVLLASHQHNAVSLKEVCLDFVQDNLNECGSALDELKSEPDLLLELLRRQPRHMGLPMLLSHQPVPPHQQQQQQQPPPHR